MKKRVIIAVIVAVVLASVLGVFASHPLILCEIEIPENHLEAIKNQSKGLYSSKLPLIPIYARIDGYSDESVFYTIHYFPFGTVGMSYNENDGYNIEKPLTGS